ncbi:hypothetical protein PQQ99_36205 [Paraburkholderia sediminicola]|uniref:hypothetical protein n=1 Tax=Paraburkholderia sediminicola TaxID=458836 RepID=UPI0038BCAFB7
MTTSSLASSSISYYSKSMPPLQQLFSKSPAFGLRKDDLTKAGAVQINGHPLTITGEDGSPLETEQIYRNLISELTANGSKFSNPADAVRMFGVALENVMLKGVERTVTEPLKGLSLKPVGEPKRVVNLVPLPSGILIHTRLAYDHLEDQQGKVIQFDTGFALEINLRHMVEFDRGDNLVERLVNKWQDNGKETHTATSYFVSAVVDTPSRVLRDGLVARSSTILDRLIDFFAQLFDAPRYVVYAPNYVNNAKLPMSTAIFPDSVGRPEAEKPLPELRKAELIREDRRVRIEHVHRAAIHKDTIRLNTKNRLLDAEKVKQTANLDLKRQRLDAHTEDRRAPASLDDVNARHTALQVFKVGNTQRATLQAWRDGKESVVTELDNVSRLKIVFEDPNKFESPPSVAASSSQAQSDKQMTFYADNTLGSLTKTSPEVLADLKRIQKTGSPVVTYALIQKIWAAADNWVATAVTNKIDGDKNAERIEALAFSSANLLDKDSVTSLFNVFAAVYLKYYEVKNSQFLTVLPPSSNPQFLNMGHYVTYVHGIHEGRQPVVGGIWSNSVFDHQPKNVNEADVVGVATLLGLEG